MSSAPAAMNLPGSQVADVTVGAAAGGNVYQQGLDGDQVVDLLGRRLERGLERIGTVLTWFLAVAAFQTALLLLVAVVVLAVLLDPRLVAGL